MTSPTTDTPSSAPDKIALAVDLDGTLLRTDCLAESFADCLRHSPFILLLIPLWLLLGGRPRLKQELASRSKLNIATLPLRKPVLEYVQAQRATGRKVVLATASDERIARAVAAHYDLFDDVIASNGSRNLKSRCKAEELTRLFGPKGFDYIGNETADYPVWRASRLAILAHPEPRLEAQLTQEGVPFHVIAEPESKPLKPLPLRILRAMRPHQWCKNLLLFLTLLAAHKFHDLTALTLACTAFVATSLCASSVYLLNDLLDLESDRNHSTKSKRPFASGTLSLAWGFITAPLLLLTGLCIAASVNLGFLGLILFYLVVTTAYSLVLKQMALLDAFTLAGLYSLRIWMGGVAASVSNSPWLMAFSMFFFLSLAMAKRCAELGNLRAQQKEAAHGRGYTVSDLDQMAVFGTVSGYIASLVFALYIQSDRSALIYLYPERLWLVCPLLLYWISRIWLLTRRCQLHEDPVIFALRDPVSYFIGALSFGVLLLAGAR